MTRAGHALALAAWLVTWSALPLSARAAMPTTFGTVIGSALLCRSHLDNHYFYSYLETAYGKPYKHEDGVYWFKTPDTTLWGSETKEVWVSRTKPPPLLTPYSKCASASRCRSLMYR